MGIAICTLGDRITLGACTMIVSGTTEGHDAHIELEVDPLLELVTQAALRLGLLFNTMELFTSSNWLLSPDCCTICTIDASTQLHTEVFTPINVKKGKQGNVVLYPALFVGAEKTTFTYDPSLLKVADRSTGVGGGATDSEAATVIVVVVVKFITYSGLEGPLSATTS